MMNILKFLLSPLLNEHGYTTLPTASIGVGKPVTTGIFTNIKTALDSFNDGTGIGDNVIIPRHLMNAEVVATNFAFPSAGTTLAPSGWGGNAALAADITYADNIGGEAATRLWYSGVGGQPPTMVRADRCLNGAPTGTKYYFSARIYIDGDALNDDVKVGWSSNQNYTGGRTDEISIIFDKSDHNIKLNVRKASANNLTTLMAYTTGVWYNVLLVWITATSINAYVDTAGSGFVLKGTYTTTANFPTVVLFPVVGSAAQASLGGAFSVYLSQAIVGKKSI